MGLEDRRRGLEGHSFEKVHRGWMELKVRKHCWAWMGRREMKGRWVHWDQMVLMVRKEMKVLRVRKHCWAWMDRREMKGRWVRWVHLVWKVHRGLMAH